MLFAANDDNEKEDENKKDENTETYDYTLMMEICLQMLNLYGKAQLQA